MSTAFEQALFSALGCCDADFSPSLLFANTLRCTAFWHWKGNPRDEGTGPVTQLTSLRANTGFLSGTLSLSLSL